MIARMRLGIVPHLPSERNMARSRSVPEAPRKPQNRPRAASSHLRQTRAHSTPRG